MRWRDHMFEIVCVFFAFRSTSLSTVIFIFCQEITTVEDAMRAYAEETKRWIILPLHSTLSIEEQDKVHHVKKLIVQ